MTLVYNHIETKHGTYWFFRTFNLLSNCYDRGMLNQLLTKCHPSEVC